MSEQAALAAFRRRLAAGKAAHLEEVPAVCARLHELRCRFGDRDIVRVLRPKLLGEGAYRELGYRAGVLAGACRRLVDRALGDPRLRGFLGVRPGEEELIAYPSRCPDPLPLCRLDSFESGMGPRFVEMNGEAPAGAGYADAALEALLEHSLVVEFAAEVSARRIDHRGLLLDALLVAWRAGGGRGTPVLLITDYLDQPTREEFEILAESFRARGVPTVVQDPRALEYRDGRLLAGGRAIDLVYRRVLVNEFLERRAELQALEAAVASGAVVMVNPFASKLAHKKAVFAVLTGEDWEEGFLTREEQRVVAESVPWTRRLRSGRTQHEGRSVDLLDFVERERARLVLKPNDEYGGRGVVLGWESTDAGWRASLDSALGRDFVVQERVETRPELFPLLHEELREAEFVVDLDPYICFGRPAGVLARLAAGSLCNVTSGGGQTPVLIVPGD
jgi:hypothetical protein